MNTEENEKKLEMIITYAKSLGIDMFLDWNGDEQDEEFVCAYVSDLKNDDLTKTIDELESEVMEDLLSEDV